MSIKVRHLTKKYYEQKAVDDISFEVNSGDVMGFLGPNGAGKSTTMKIITCFIPQTSGTASVYGYDVNVEPMQVRRHIGYLPEQTPLYDQMYIKEYLRFIAGLHGLKNGVEDRIEEMIDLTGLNPERRKKIGQLSKGFRQRVGLAQAMLHDPPVLILDEPTTGLDPNQVIEIRELIKSLGQRKTVILSTHIMQEVQAICNRVVIINEGRLVADDTTENLQQQISSALVLVVQFDKSAPRQQLENIEGVQQVEEKKDYTYHIHYDADTDIRPPIFEFAVQQDLTLLNMQQAKQSIEQVFHELTQSNGKNGEREEH